MKKMSFEERKKQILKIAFDLFAKNGFKKTTTKTIAEKAGISEALLYKHFSSKKELYESIRNYTKKQINEIINKLPAKNAEINKIEDLKNYLYNFILNFLKLTEKKSKLIRLIMYAKLEDPEFSSLMIQPEEEPGSPLKSIFQKAIDKGLIKSVDSKLLSKYFFGIISSITEMKRITKPEKNKNSITELNKNIDIILDLFFNGIVKDS